MDLTSTQKKTVVAAFLGWTLDAFDFFLLVFLLGDIAKEFGVQVSDVAYAVFLTLAMRFIGAYIFGRLGDRFGRKPILMLDIVCYSVIGALAAFSPTLWAFLALRALFGIAMGGEWGLGSSLAMESIPPQSRGYRFRHAAMRLSRRLSARLDRLWPFVSEEFRRFYVQLARDVPAQHHPRARSSCISARMSRNLRLSPRQEHARKPTLIETLRANWGVALYAIVLMMCFNLFSHGTQDLYPTFLQKQHSFNTTTVSWITIVANLGAIVGGLFFGFVSEKIGRVNAITIAALIALPALPLWAYSSTPFMLAIGAFVMQISVQGAWGVIPAHLNEISPGAVRATLPGFVYQVGNFLASYNGPFQAKLAEAHGNNYSFALALVAGIVAIAIVIIIRFSPERRGEVMTVTA